MARTKSTRTTASDIAAEAGVSVATVSKVLNGRADVAPETRKRIQQLVDKNDYVRRPTQTGDSSGLIDLVFDGLDTPWGLEILLGVEDVAHQHGLGVVVTSDHSEPEIGRAWMKNVARRRSDGIIFALAELSEKQHARMSALNLPFVVVDPVGQPDSDVLSVGASNYAGGQTATQHLVDLGHTRIAFLGGPPRLLCSRARLDGYLSALRGASMTVDDTLITTGEFRSDNGFQSTLQLMNRPYPPTAIFAASDQQAMGAYEALRSLGLEAGREVSIVGFDDLPSSSLLQPRLTTIRQPIRAMASTAAQMLMQAINGSTTPTHVDLATELIVRESTCPAD